MPLGKFQTLEAKGWMGTTSRNHLGSIFKTQPQKASDLMIQLLTRKLGKTLNYYLNQFPVKNFETDDEYYWELIGSSRRNIPLVEARYQGSVVAASENNIGAGGSTFQLVFEEDWFADGNRIVGERNEVYPIRVLGEGEYEGSYTVYECELMGGVINGMPGEELISGKRFSVDFSPVEDTMSRQVGDVRFTAPVSMRNEWSTIRIKHEVAGNMMDRKVLTGIPHVTREGEKKVSTMWMHHVDYTVETTFEHEKNLALMYARSNRLANGEYQNIGKSGHVIKEGDGIRAQMEVSNTIYYDEFTLKLIEDILLDLSESKLEFGDRMFMMRTGERGAAAFSKAVMNTTSGWNAFNYFGGNASVNTIKGTSSELHSNSLSAGFQFTEYRFANNIVVKVEVDPFYDDRERNKIRHPKGGVAESYRYDILYIGTKDMEVPNIQLCRVKNIPDYRGYQWGPFRNPFTGETGNDNASFDDDKAVYHKQATLGSVIYDPSRVLALIPRELA